MTLQVSEAVDNAMLNAAEAAIGASPILKLRTGAPPANEAAADTGTVLATLALPADWMAAASGRTKAMSGTWSDASADASGIAGHFRLYATDGTTCHMQGTVGSAGEVDLVVDDAEFFAGQPFSITGFTWTVP